MDKKTVTLITKAVNEVNKSFTEIGKKHKEEKKANKEAFSADYTKGYLAALKDVQEVVKNYKANLVVE